MSNTQDSNMCISQTFDFSDVLRFLKKGHKFSRQGWNGKGLHIAMQFPDDNSKMTLPYLYIEYPADANNTPGARGTWSPSQTDLLATDWVVVE